ncbi:MAG: HigA family addiction module antidote protein [Magnetococcales bacterium]|nr:HigA family addiction module antidote protein [Magnetococcales bacterium]
MSRQRTRNRKPTHPGGILQRQYMEPLGLNITKLSERLGVSRKTLSKIVNERGSITADMALRLSKAFDTTPSLWLNLQQAVDLWEAQQGEEWSEVESLALCPL